MENPELNVEGAEVTLTDVYAMFYLLVKQNQKLHPGSSMSFDLRAFKNLPKKVSINFLREDDKLYVWIPEKRKRSKLVLPPQRIITPN